MSIRRGGVCGVKSKACRNLFGPVDHEEVDAYLKKELGKIQEEQNQKWNFDFGTDTPRDGSFEWEPVYDNVPQFYQARILVSPRCVKRTSHPDNVTDTRLTTTITNHSSTACGLGDHIRPTQSDQIDENTPSQSDLQKQPDNSFATPKSRGTNKYSKRTSATRKTTKLTRANQIQISDCFRQRKSPKRKLQLCVNDQTGSAIMSVEKQPRMVEETVQS
ncbi:cyclin dependent kinase inhibitor 1C-like protein isoform X1 [Saccoglossus kowalevskii]|uniref:Cyclin dependent kinase inhibitor 1C-like protein n=1 Tax=Saccoglossus kowalevskii TaxID=10224 RepID=D1LWZ4_SACKO|nr:cyclin dependent kinase inhibitor 1C-like protein [Saccoglossus kowalevskii]XP_006818464.1 PREDICTED: cyclin dependent kinase inhibitor 1C-like protein isoform X3 [Saccoglossus kowalevskii]ACY92500.1 cyclin dependent kinase inhibitor 1C-like protein [Saccoglossus kowalevskii]